MNGRSMRTLVVTLLALGAALSTPVTGFAQSSVAAKTAAAPKAVAKADEVAAKPMSAKEKAALKKQLLEEKKVASWPAKIAATMPSTPLLKPRECEDLGGAIVYAGALCPFQIACSAKASGGKPHQACIDQFDK